MLIKVRPIQTKNSYLTFKLFDNLQFDTVFTICNIYKKCYILIDLFSFVQVEINWKKKILSLQSFHEARLRYYSNFIGNSGGLISGYKLFRIGFATVSQPVP